MSPVGTVSGGLPITQKLAEGEGKEDRLQSDGKNSSITPPPIIAPTLRSPRVSSGGVSGGIGIGTGTTIKSARGNSYHRGDGKVTGSSSSTLPSSSSGITPLLIY